jgi:hypothetical protein
MLFPVASAARILANMMLAASSIIEMMCVYDGLPANRWCMLASI